MKEQLLLKKRLSISASLTVAYTIAAISAAIACLLYLISRRIPPVAPDQSDKIPDAKNERLNRHAS